MPWQSLKSALLFNAVVCALIGAVLVIDAAPVAAIASAYAGAIEPLVATIAGAALLVVAVDLAWVASRRPIPITLAKLLTGADAAFVLAVPIVMIAAAPRLSNIGQLLLADLALITAFCVWCQWRGLRHAPAKLMQAGR